MADPVAIPLKVRDDDGTSTRDLTKDELMVLYSWSDELAEDAKSINRAGKKDSGRYNDYMQMPLATSLTEIVRRCFLQTVQRDGSDLGKGDMKVSVTAGKSEIRVALGKLTKKAAGQYEAKLADVHRHGLDAIGPDAAPLATLMRNKKEGKRGPKWNPDDSEVAWHPFLAHGLPMLNQKGVQFFHYPPVRLMTVYQDYLCDPVPKRWEELLMANGVPPDEVALYEAIVDGIPIAAGDDQGGNMPVSMMKLFSNYQKGQVAVLLSEHPCNPDYTFPVVVYGAHPRDAFCYSFVDPKAKFKFNQALVTTNCCPEQKKTPVLLSQHPYNFYASVQETAAGSGKLKPASWVAEKAARMMRTDLAAARWQHLMAAQDPATLGTPQECFNECVDYWNDVARSDTVGRLIMHQTSFYSKDPASGGWSWKIELDWEHGPVPSGDEWRTAKAEGYPPSQAKSKKKTTRKARK